MILKTAAIAFALATAGLGASSPASAQAEPRGFYLGGSIGQMEADGSCDPGQTCDFKDTAWKLFGGYRINRHFAAEAFYGNLGEISITQGSIRATDKITTLGIAALGILPVGQRFELFAKAGLARTEQKLRGTGPGVTLTDRESGRDFLFGFGAAYNFTPNLGVRAEWERLNDSDADILSIGLQYRF